MIIKKQIKKQLLLFIFSIFLLLNLTLAVHAKNLQLVAIQMQLNMNDYYSQENFEEKIIGIMEKVEQKITKDIPALVVFPEDVGLMLIAQNNKKILAGIDNIEEAIKKMTLRYLLPVSYNRLKYNISWVPALYLYHHKTIAQSYFQTFEKAAQEFQVYIIAGSVALPHFKLKEGKVFYEDGPIGYEIYNSSYLFDPDGKVVGYQDKVYLLELEKEEGLHLTPGTIDNIQVFNTKAGKFGIAICLDGFKEDVIEQLRRRGAEILVQPSANPLPWDQKQQQEWLESSYKYTYGLKYFKYAINPMMNGRFLNLEFFGQSSITSMKEEDKRIGFKDIGPLEGFLMVSDTDDQEEILVLKVDL